MCDDLTLEDAESFLKTSELSRREFAKRTTAVAIAALLPSVANAMDVTEADVLVETPDGEADCYFVHPATGKHPAVIIWPDIVSIRPAFKAMGKRLAESGYAVLVMNPYYRTARGTLVEPGQTFRDPAVREMLMPHARSLSPTTCTTDGKALVEFLDNQAAVDSERKMGTSGYCMTGSYPLRLAAAMPERIGAGASFHSGVLATDEDDSPHLLIPEADASFLIAIAENDDERRPEEKHTLIESFRDAKSSLEIEVYPGTQHGWCPPDSAVYDDKQANRAWSQLLSLLERELKS